MRQAMKYKAELGTSYKEIYYEELTSEPQKVLTGLCDFLNISFIPEMLKIKKSNEFHGDAKGSNEIMINSQKYLSELTDRQIERIECLAMEPMIHFGYELMHKVKPEKLSKREEALYRASDIWNMYLFYVKEQGLVKATSYFFKLKKNDVSVS